MADNVNVVTFVACEKVIQEAGSGKKSIIGIFQNFNMKQLPSRLGSAWFLFGQIMNLDPGKVDVTVNIVHDETQGVVFAASIEIPDGHPENADLMLQADATEFRKEGKHVVSLNIGGMQYAHFVLKVVLTPQTSGGN